MTYQDYLNITAMLIKEEELSLRKYSDSIHIYFNTNDVSRVHEILGWYEMEGREPLEAEDGTLIFDDYKIFDDETIYVTVYVKKIKKTPRTRCHRNITYKNYNTKGE